MNENSVPFITLSEDYNRYKLENDIILKVKITCKRIIDTGQTDAQGNPILNIDGQTETLIEGNIETHEPSANVRIEESDIIDKNINFETIDERVQVYHIPKHNQIVLMTALPVRIRLTSKYDHVGYPIYHVSTKNKLMTIKFPVD